MHQENDWVTRIIKLESDISKWKVKFEIESLWRSVVQDWILHEFDFDIAARVNSLEKNLGTNQVIDVSFSTNNSNVNFEKLKKELLSSTHSCKISNGYYDDTSPDTVLSKLPDSIEVTEVQPSPSNKKLTSKIPDVIAEPAEMIEVSPDYGLEFDFNGDDERQEYPLTIYDDDDEVLELEDTCTRENHVTSDDVDTKDLVYKTDGLAFTIMEPVFDYDNEQQMQNSGFKIRANKSLIQTICMPGNKRKFQCRACSRIFNDRGNGHRHVRRMHPGSSLADQRRAEMEQFEYNSPMLEPEIILNENSEIDEDMESYYDNNTEDDNDEDDEFEDEKESFQFDETSKLFSNNCSVGKLSEEKRNAAAKLIKKLGENRYKCIQCGRLFSVSCNARRHVRVVHFGERLYACQLCQKQFSSKTDGVLHERTCMGRKIRKIEGDPPSFECKMCCSRYTDLHSAWFHAKKMHLVDSEKPHKCPNCPRSYFNRKDLLRHMNKCGAVSNFGESLDQESSMSSESTHVDKKLAGNSDLSFNSSKSQIITESNSDYGLEVTRMDGDSNPS